MTRRKDPFSALRIKEFRWFLAMRLAMVLAWSMQFVLIEWEVYSITKDPWSLGLIGLMEVIPAIAMALFAGHIVDQSEKRGLLLKCLSGLTLISTLMCLLVQSELTALLSKDTVLFCIYALVFLGGIVRAFIIPSVFSLLGLTVPKQEYANAATWSSSTWQIAAVFGPAFAGFAIGWIGVFWSMVFVVSCLVAALLLLTPIRPKPILNPKIGEPIAKSLKEGISFVFQNKTILNAISLDMFAVLFGGAVALLPVFAQDILKVGSEGFGILRAAPAIGSLLTMLVATSLSLNHNAGKKLLLAVFGFGICILVFGLSTNFWISVVALFLSGITDGISVVIRQTILQIYTPDHMRGRVSSVNSIFVGSSNELGAFESGLTSRLFGVVPAVVFGGIMTLVVTGTMGVVSPKFRNLNIEKDLA
ncbi:MFS transporter [Flavobacterium suncheonense]|uniref:MFS transporter n=1 Tax=Flavobacterium suncheonense GH29-5 = DSM 17707 TaxID=1121899 RepID=A0A0A2MDN2_9FLAO|nr:MFS transporter [Flavobacterium suncheonense]KGO90399.1 MFS transporter [Flavobacterium suncheonense GH29-5 = DSM 17707]